MNACGECSACCYELPVTMRNGIKKPERVWCKHKADAGCDIYPGRPTGCREFRCAWLRSKERREEDRPDRSNILGYFVDGAASEPATLRLLAVDPLGEINEATARGLAAEAKRNGLRVFIRVAIMEDGRNGFMEWR